MSQNDKQINKLYENESPKKLPLYYNNNIRNAGLSYASSRTARLTNNWEECLQIDKKTAINSAKHGFKYVKKHGLEQPLYVLYFLAGRGYVGEEENDRPLYKWYFKGTPFYNKINEFCGRAYIEDVKLFNSFEDLKDFLLNGFSYNGKRITPIETMVSMIIIDRELHVYHSLEEVTQHEKD